LEAQHPASNIQHLTPALQATPPNIVQAVCLTSVAAVGYFDHRQDKIRFLEEVNEINF
jgi:hypothetical protein